MTVDIFAHNDKQRKEITMKPITVNELPLELRNQILKENGVSTRNYSMKIDDVRRESIAVLNVIKSHSQKNRVRILNHALKTNEV